MSLSTLCSRGVHKSIWDTHKIRWILVVGNLQVVSDEGVIRQPLTGNLGQAPLLGRFLGGRGLAQPLFRLPSSLCGIVLRLQSELAMSNI